MNKYSSLLLSTLLAAQLAPVSSTLAQTIQDVPVGESVIASKGEDPLQHYEEGSQTQDSTAESESSTADSEVLEDVSTSSTMELDDEPVDIPTLASDSSDQPAEITNLGVEEESVEPLAVTELREGNDGDDPASYDIDKKFADAIRLDDKSAPNPITVEYMESVISLDVVGRSLTSLKGIEYAVKLKHLDCYSNKLSELDISKNANLTSLNCNNNPLSKLDVSKNGALTSLTCVNNQLSELDISKNANLTSLTCSNNPLSKLDVSKNGALTSLTCDNNQLSELDISKNANLTSLTCSNNPLSKLDVSKNGALTSLTCVNNQLSELDISKNANLTSLTCSNNSLSKLDVSKNGALTSLTCDNNQLSELDISKNVNLTSLTCDSNKLSELDVSKSVNLTSLICSDNRLSELDVSKNVSLRTFECISNRLGELDVSKNVSLRTFDCSYNQLNELDVSKNKSLTTLTCSDNSISDITSANKLTSLTRFNAASQKITVPVPAVSKNGEASVEVLKTTAKKGLTATNGTVSPAPTSMLPNSNNGDIIELTGVTRQSLTGKNIRFSYASSDLSEGATSSKNKQFSGTITFIMASELENELQVAPKKANKEGKLKWTWTITSLTKVKAEDIKAKFTLSNSIAGDITNIVITRGSNNAVGDLNHLTGNTSLGDLEEGESLVITFESVAHGNPNEWLEAIGQLDWADDVRPNRMTNESRQSIKILDDEQQELPEEGKGIGLLSAPSRFHFGRQDFSSSIQTYHLASQNYQTNTQVVSEGFYTRMKDDRPVSTGWKLTASLSEFKDLDGHYLPNGAGTSLNLKNMYLQNVTDRDTAQEAINPSPAGKPTTIQNEETLVAGQTAKALVSAQVGQGQGTWQLRMPFEDVTLILPASAGKRNMDYTAKMTWSLDETP
ncbi:WxL domain-containing protein [Enterococcus sp. AZ109]|uniref:WxL domain-containing protein n=1 Tax=Enterococcus sp. AZ109 TaxID=2774634 RepID=UPI003F20054D